MNYRNFSFSNSNYIILMEKTTQHATPGGNWSRKGVTTERFIYTPEQYTNYITAIPFFNSFDYGASCRAHHNYTCAGYLPTEVNTISPGRDTRITATFIFIDVRYARDSAGYRERAVFDNAVNWEPFPAGGRICYTFRTEDGQTATYEPGYSRWVN